MECEVCLGLVAVTHAEVWEVTPTEVHPDFLSGGTFWACDRCDGWGKVTVSRRLFDRQPYVLADQAGYEFLRKVKQRRGAAR